MREVPKPKKTLSEKIGSGIDKVIGIWNPEKAYRRQSFRQASKIRASSGSSGYQGAGTNRLRSDWSINDASADQEVIPNLAALRARSRDLNRNNAFAAGITSTITSNDIGTGIRAQSRPDNTIMKLPETKLKKFTTMAERAFNLWIPEASADDRMDFYDLQHLCDRSVLETGEFLAIPKMIDDDPNRTFKFAWQTIEPDRLMTPTDKLKDKKIRAGVEIGERGQPVAYWIRKNHPGDQNMTTGLRSNHSENFIRYEAKNKETGRPNVIHIFISQRSGQSRGIPFFAPVMTYFKDLADYMDTKLVQARVAACFAVFVKKTDPAGSVLGSTDDINSAGQKLSELEPGIVEHLAEGESIETASPPSDNSMEPFVLIILRSISAALGLPYELVAKDFSKSNFANARAALLEARRYFQWRQQWLARKFCQPSWDFVIEEAFLNDMLPRIDFFENKKDLCRVRWITPGWQWIDPLKEAQAGKVQLENGMASYSDIAAERGKDWEEQFEQMAKEKKRIKELEEKHGIKLFEEKDSSSKSNSETNPDRNTQIPDKTEPDSEEETDTETESEENEE